MVWYTSVVQYSYFQKAAATGTPTQQPQGKAPKVLTSASNATTVTHSQRQKPGQHSEQGRHKITLMRVCD
ncbi:hypothetical protein E2C01_011347 [Portunus trituberculatus]|uniref:Uncharacterized protein n=1 Tax=Portunus trituberculatus TaxID=210409 RepID=A0A5B7DAS8_PORTR|nr:hypothetical protein [Portunus trituberculatus]